MFCYKCGTRIPDDSQWCPSCGAQVVADGPAPAQAVNTVQQAAPGAISGFILSLAGFLLDAIPLVGLVMSVIGVVLCSKGKKQLAANPSAYANTGLLTAGEVIGIIGIVCGALSLVFWIFWATMLGGGTLMMFDIFRDLMD